MVICFIIYAAASGARDRSARQQAESGCYKQTGKVNQRISVAEWGPGLSAKSLIGLSAAVLVSGAGSEQCKALMKCARARKGQQMAVSIKSE